MLQRIQHLTVLEHAEVQMGPRVSDSGAADLAEALACFHPVADLYVVVREMRV